MGKSKFIVETLDTVAKINNDKQPKYGLKTLCMYHFSALKVKILLKLTHFYANPNCSGKSIRFDKICVERLKQVV